MLVTLLTIAPVHPRNARVMSRVSLGTPSSVQPHNLFVALKFPLLPPVKSHKAMEKLSTSVAVELELQRTGSNCLTLSASPAPSRWTALNLKARAMD